MYELLKLDILTWEINELDFVFNRSYSKAYNLALKKGSEKNNSYKRTPPSKYFCIYRTPEITFSRGCFGFLKHKQKLVRVILQENNYNTLHESLIKLKKVN